MKRHVPVVTDGQPTPAVDLALLVAAVALMLAGAGMIFGGVSGGIAIPLIAIGIAVTAIAKYDRQRRGRGA
jgi:hypothetical protein